MARMEIGAAMTADASECVIQLHQDGKALGHITLDASSLEGFIHDLAEIRSSMSEIVAPELSPSSRIFGTSHPSWKIPKDRIKGNRILILRHPGHGWLGYEFRLDVAREIAEWLQKTSIE